MAQHDPRLDNLEKGTYKLVHESQTIEVPVGQSVNNPRQKEPVSVNAVVSGEIEKAKFKKPTAVFYNTLDGSEFGRFNFADDAEVQTQGGEIGDLAKGLEQESKERKDEDSKIHEELNLVESEVSDVAKALLDESKERQESDEKQQKQIDTNKSEITTLTKGLLEESKKRKEEDDKLQAQIDKDGKEISDLTKGLLDESKERKETDDKLQTQIDTSKKEITALTTGLETESKERKEEVRRLDDRINTIQTGEVTREEFDEEKRKRLEEDKRLSEAILDNEKALTAETEERKREINTINEAIENEKNERVNKDNEQDEILKLEVTNRQNGDKKLAEDIKTEENERIMEDSQIKGGLENEVANRKSADENLQKQIDELQKDVGVNTISIDSEISTRIEADKDLQKQIDEKIPSFDESNLNNILTVVKDEEKEGEFKTSWQPPQGGDVTREEFNDLVETVDTDSNSIRNNNQLITLEENERKTAEKALDDRTTYIENNGYFSYSLIVGRECVFEASELFEGTVVFKEDNFNIMIVNGTNVDLSIISLNSVDGALTLKTTKTLRSRDSVLLDIKENEDSIGILYLTITIGNYNFTFNVEQYPRAPIRIKSTWSKKFFHVTE